jgi:chromatin remodeling complex protein RSC6
MSSTKTTKVSKKETKEVKDEVKPEPVVEVKPDVVENEEVDNENETKKVTFDELFESLSERAKNLTSEARALTALLTQLRRAHNQELRAQSQKKKTRRVAVDSGILKPVPVPAEALAFLKAVGTAVPESGLMRRTELSGHIYDYVKSKNLYKVDPSRDSGYDRKVILPDSNLRTLFGLSDDKTLDFSSINANLAVIYRRMKESQEGGVTTTTKTVETTAPVVTKVAAAAKGKGKAATSSS